MRREWLTHTLCLCCEQNYEGVQYLSWILLPAVSNKVIFSFCIINVFPLLKFSCSLPLYLTKTTPPSAFRILIVGGIDCLKWNNLQRVGEKIKCHLPSPTNCLVSGWATGTPESTVKVKCAAHLPTACEHGAIKERPTSAVLAAEPWTACMEINYSILYLNMFLTCPVMVCMSS